MRKGALSKKIKRYHELDKQIKLLSKEYNELKAQFKNHVGDIDDNNEQVVTYGENELVLVSTIRRSAKLNANAVEIIQEDKSFRKHKKRLIEDVQVVRTDRLEKLIATDELTPKQIKKIYDTGKSIATSVKLRKPLQENDEESTYRQ